MSPSSDGGLLDACEPTICAGLREPGFSDPIKIYNYLIIIGF